MRLRLCRLLISCDRYHFSCPTYPQSPQTMITCNMRAPFFIEIRCFHLPCWTFGECVMVVIILSGRHRTSLAWLIMVHNAMQIITAPNPDVTKSMVPGFETETQHLANFETSVLVYWIWWVSMVNWVWPPTPVNSDLFQDWIYIFLGSWIPFWTFCLELGATGSPKINMFSPRNHLKALKCLVFPHLISLHPFFSCDAPAVAVWASSPCLCQKTHPFHMSQFQSKVFEDKFWILLLVAWKHSSFQGVFEIFMEP